MVFTNEFVLQLILSIGGILSLYTALKEDIGKLHERVSNAKERADKAHDRIDSILGKE
jgi:hypothetical protein